MHVYLTENAKTETRIYSNENMHPDQVLEDVRRYAHNRGKIVRDFNTVYSDGPTKFKKAIYCTATIA